MLFTYLKLGFSLKDKDFDKIYPQQIQNLSFNHWTPHNVAIKAARNLVKNCYTKVLDIGCGVGKFCFIGSAVTGANFTGVEQREDLVEIARNSLRFYNVSNVNIIKANITQINFLDYDAFYFFNPFYENLIAHSDKSINGFSTDLYYEYTEYVKKQLELMPVGTKIATYYGLHDEIPLSYDVISTEFEGALKVWEKQSDHNGNNYMQEKLIQQAVRSLKQFGFENANNQNILREGVYKIYFEKILRSKLGQAEFIDEAVNKLLKKISHK
jgi:SAM-dependent methyltransferase